MDPTGRRKNLRLVTPENQLAPEMEKNRFQTFSELLGAVKSSANDTAAASSKSDPRNRSLNALKSEFERTISESKLSRDKRKVSLCNFNALFRDASCEKGLLGVLAEAIEMANGSFEDVKEEADRLLLLFRSKNIDKTIHESHKFLDRFKDKELDCLFPSVMRHMLSVQYMLSCIYINMPSKEDEGEQILLKYFNNAKLMGPNEMALKLIVLQQSLHALSVIRKNKGEFHMARLLLESERKLIDLMQLKMRSGTAFFPAGFVLSVKYRACFSVLGRTHSSLGNHLESAFFFEKAALAQEAKNYDAQSSRSVSFMDQFFGYQESKAKKEDRAENRDEKDKEENKENTEKESETQEPEDKENKERKTFRKLFGQSNQAQLQLEDGERRLMEGEIFRSAAELRQRESRLGLAEKIEEKITSAPSRWKFSERAFDSCLFLFELSERVLEDGDVFLAQNNFGMFERHFLRLRKERETGERGDERGRESLVD